MLLGGSDDRNLCVTNSGGQKSQLKESAVLVPSGICAGGSGRPVPGTWELAGNRSACRGIILTHQACCFGKTGAATALLG